MRFIFVCVKPDAKQKAYKEAQSWIVNFGACYYSVCVFFRSLIFLFLLNTHMEMFLPSLIIFYSASHKLLLFVREGDVAVNILLESKK